MRDLTVDQICEMDPYDELLTIAEVEEHEQGWDLSFEGGKGFGFGKDKTDRAPRVGDRVHLWGAFGYPVRGIAVAGKVLWYRTEAEQGEENRRLAEKMKQERRERFERDKADLDRQYAALPEVFRRRIDRFRENNPDFRWEYEAYELFCCAEAVKIAHTAIREYVTTPGEWIQRFYKMPYEEQVLIAGIEDGHSGNTFGMACALARLFCEHREGVARAHGALAPLVGSKAYGCVPREDEESKP